MPVNNQNVIIDANAQAAAAQMAQQILANTNVTLKQELSRSRISGVRRAKIPSRLHNSWPESTNAKWPMTGMTLPRTQSLCLRGEADEWLACTIRLHEFTAAQRTWTRIRPLFKKEFAACSDNKLIIDGLAKISPTDQVKILANSCQGWKNYSTCFMKTTLHIMSFQTGQHQSSHKAPTRRTISRHSPMTAFGPTTNSSLRKCSGWLLQKTYGSCSLTRIKQE